MSGEIIYVTIEDPVVEVIDVVVNNQRGPIGPDGPAGPVAYLAQDNSPSDTTFLWVDTDDDINSNLARLDGATFSGPVIVPDATEDTHALNRTTGDARYLQESEVPNIKTFVVPASTTISPMAKTFLDDLTAAQMRSTLELGPGDSITVALSDMTTEISATGNPKAYWVNPFGTALTITKVKATLMTAGTSQTIVDINEGEVSILSTKIRIDALETDSDNATTQPVISDTSIAANGRLTFDIDTAGALATGLIVYIMFTRVV